MASIIGSSVLPQYSHVNLKICERETVTPVIRKAKYIYKGHHTHTKGVQKK